MLHINDKLKLQNSEDTFVDEIGLEQLDAPVQVFNFELKTSYSFCWQQWVFLYIISPSTKRVRKAWAKEKLLYRMVLQNITGRQKDVPS